MSRSGRETIESVRTPGELFARPAPIISSDFSRANGFPPSHQPHLPPGAGGTPPPSASSFLTMLRLNTFGGLVLQQDGQHTGPASQRRRLALVAVVAAAGRRGASRDKLLALLWADSDAEPARHSHYQAVHAICRSVGSEEIFLGATTLQLNPQLITSDVCEFDEAVESDSHEQAVRLYRGPFLDGFRLEAASAYEQWQDGERVRHALGSCPDRVPAAASSLRHRSTPSGHSVPPGLERPPRPLQRPRPP